ncbi:MAG: hypothetical protein ACM34K_12490 [Bacillota bacterium]
MEKPILFSTPMVESILDDRKSQTRRIMKIQPPSEKHIFSQVIESTNRKQNGKCHWVLPNIYVNSKNDSSEYFNWPYRKGDHLWVKEPYGFKVKNDSLGGSGNFLVYKADNPTAIAFEDCSGAKFPVKWKTSRFMPKKYARIWLEVTAARVERLNDISEQDAVAEGVEPCLYHHWADYSEKPEFQKSATLITSPIESYMSLWNSLNGKGSWEKNPWVWAITFRRIS